MKKSRNSFFQESNFQSYNTNAFPPMAQSISGANYFYQGPVPNNYTTNYPGNDIESRLAKIERQINRMDYRISKLENSNQTFSIDDVDANNSNMYML